MEKINDLLNNLKDRISNPLIFSFFCAWLTINWQITICLIWYDPIQISNYGSKSIFEFISANLNASNSLYKPLLFALAYTIAMPIIKNLISAFYSWTTKWGQNWNLNITKGIKIPFEKYLKFREDFDKRTKILEEVIGSESTSQLELNRVQTELFQERANLNDLQQSLSETNGFISQLYNVNMLNGYWTNRYVDSINKTLNGSEDVYIDNGRYYIIEKFGKKNHSFNIINFFFDNRNNSIFFVKERVNQERIVIFANEENYLRFNPNSLNLERNDLIVGIENGTTQIEYRKKDVSSIFHEDDENK